MKSLNCVALVCFVLLTACNQKKSFDGSVAESTASPADADAQPSNIEPVAPVVAPPPQVQPTPAAPVVSETGIDVTPPREGCEGWFSGVIAMEYYGKTSKFPEVTEEAFVVSRFSELVGSGRYPDNNKAFPKAVATTFDSLAMAKGTTVTIYEKPNFEGKILFKESGPYVLYNVKWKSNSKYANLFKIDWNKRQDEFPLETRHWSETDTQPWSKGSVVVECEP